MPTDSRSFGEGAVFSADGSVIGDTKYTIDVDMNSGFGLLAAFGRGPETGLRWEIEIGYRRSDWLEDSRGDSRVNFQPRTPEQGLTPEQGFPQPGEDVGLLVDRLGEEADRLTDEALEQLQELLRKFSTPNQVDLTPTRVDSVTNQFNYSFAGYSKSLSLMANAIYTFDAGRVRPYVGGGLGFARHDVTIEAGFLEVAVSYDDQDEQDASRSVRAIERTSRDDTVLAMQAMFGVSFPMSERLEARLGYRYFRTRDTGDSDGNGLRYSTRNIEAGLLFRF